jgi:acyl-coenzyme A synthetase/AMP-(fatty) acid ligase
MIFRSEEPYTPVPEASVYDLLFEGDTKIDPKKPCYISAEDPSQIITYAELKQLILKLVVGLKQAVPDFTKGDVVAIYSPNNVILLTI